MENQQKALVLREIRKSGNIKKICEKHKIHRTQFYRECDKDPVFSAKVRVAKSDFILKGHK